MSNNFRIPLRLDKQQVKDLLEPNYRTDNQRRFPILDQQKTIQKLSIKRIPPELHRKRTNYRQEPIWNKRLLRRMKEDSQFLRAIVQAAFVLLCIWIGIEFYLFMKWATSTGQQSFFPRSPGAEGFLPISALISLKYWLQTGTINDIHPSGLFILLAILAVSFLLKKSFCSWLCPIGTLSEGLWMFGRKVFGRNLTVTKWLDYPLRSLKYLLLVFFVWSIWQMDVPTLKSFIYSPYNKVADIKMYLFFSNISTFTLWTIILLMIFSVFINNFWCRYLCPYGVLLGSLSWLSPLKITRSKSTCIDCELCTKACPANIKVHEAKRVVSDECTACLECVQKCPIKNTLDIRTSFTNTHVPNWIFGTLVIGVFIAITGFAILTGHWQNSISKDEYQKRLKEIESPIYQHFQGKVPEYGPND